MNVVNWENGKLTWQSPQTIESTRSRGLSRDIGESLAWINFLGFSSGCVELIDNGFTLSSKSTSAADSTPLSEEAIGVSPKLPAGFRLSVLRIPTRILELSVLMVVIVVVLLVADGLVALVLLLDVAVAVALCGGHDFLFSARPPAHRAHLHKELNIKK